MYIFFQKVGSKSALPTLRMKAKQAPLNFCQRVVLGANHVTMSLIEQKLQHHAGDSRINEMRLAMCLDESMSGTSTARSVIRRVKSVKQPATQSIPPGFSLEGNKALLHL